MLENTVKPSLTYQSEWVNEHMLVLLVEINLKALKKAQLKFV